MKTALYDKHRQLGAKMVDFAGWEMPVYYSGIIEEHVAVRERVGLFDVSHMGRIVVEGEDAESFLDFVCTNQISGKSNGLAIYTVLPHENGGSVDDVMIYKIDSTHFFIVVNASNREKDKAHLMSRAASFRVSIRDCFADEGILAIQGPEATHFAGSRFPIALELKPMHFAFCEDMGKQVIVSRTGYTGSGGFEIIAPHASIVNLWEDWIARGVKPIGLGARDTLRLEMGYALYGHELSDSIAASESVSAWTVKWDKGPFLGKEGMISLKKASEERRAYGVVLVDKGIAREGCQVLRNDRVIGTVTSGTHSPTLNQAIALILVSEPLSQGDRVNIRIRDRLVEAVVAKLPFVKITS